MEQLLLGGMMVAAAVVLSIAPVALLGLALPYLVVRLKAEPPEDTQLGAKIAFQFFFSAGILVILAGITILAADWLTLYPYRYPRSSHPLGRTSFSEWAGQGFNIAQRTGVGLIGSGTMAVVAHLLLLHALTVPNRLRIQRLFVGWRLAIHGVVLMLALSALLILLLQKEPFEEPVESPLRAVTATLVVWGVSWGVHLERLLTLTKRRRREQDSAASEARPAMAVSPPVFSINPAVETVKPPVGPVAPATVFMPPVMPADSSLHAPVAPISTIADTPSAPELAPLDLDTPVETPPVGASDSAQAAAGERPNGDSSAPPAPPPLPSEQQRPSEDLPEKPSDAD